MAKKKHRAAAQELGQQGAAETPGVAAKQSAGQRSARQQGAREKSRLEQAFTKPEVSDAQAPVIERILAYTGLALIILGVIAYLTNMVVAMNVSREAFASGGLVIIGYAAYFAMPLGFACIFVLLFLSLRRRRREQDASSK